MRARRMFFNRRRSEPQRLLKKTPYPDEETLQRFLGELLPWWEDGPMAVVREYWVPPDHSADFTGVDLNDDRIVVEGELEPRPPALCRVGSSGGSTEPHAQTATSPS